MKKTFSLLGIIVALGATTVMAQTVLPVVDDARRTHTQFFELGDNVQTQCQVRENFLFYADDGADSFLLEDQIFLDVQDNWIIDTTPKSWISVYANNIITVGDFKWFTTGRESDGPSPVVAFSNDQPNLTLGGSDQVPGGYSRLNPLAQVVYHIERSPTPDGSLDIPNLYRTEPGDSTVTEIVPPMSINGIFGDPTIENECINIHVGRCGDGVVDNFPEMNNVPITGDISNLDIDSLNISLNGGEACEIGAMIPGTGGERYTEVTCTTGCQLTRCGDGVIQPINGMGEVEQCEVGAIIPGSGLEEYTTENCSNTCMIIDECPVIEEPSVVVSNSCGGGVATITLPDLEGSYVITVVGESDGFGNEYIYTDTVVGGQELVVPDSLDSGSYEIELCPVGQDCTQAGSCFFVADEAFEVTATSLEISNISQGGPVCEETTGFSFDLAGLDASQNQTVLVSYSQPGGQGGSSFRVNLLSSDINQDGSLTTRITSPANILGPGTWNFTVTVVGEDDCMATGVVVVQENCCEEIPIVLDTSKPSTCEDTNSITVQVGGLEGDAANFFTIWYTNTDSEDISDWIPVTTSLSPGNNTYTINGLTPGSWRVRISDNLSAFDGFPECFTEQQIDIRAEVSFTLTGEILQCAETGTITLGGLDGTYTVTYAGPTNVGPMSVTTTGIHGMGGFEGGDYTVTVQQDGNSFCESTQDLTLDILDCECGDDGFDHTADPDDDLNCTYGDLNDGLEDDECNITNGESCQYCRNDCMIITETPDPVCGDGVQNPNEACDDGDDDNTDACNVDCEITTCGDSITQPLNGMNEVEQCDDGNNTDDDACSNSCEVNTDQPVCGSSLDGETFYVDDNSGDELDTTLGLCDIGDPSDVIYDSNSNIWSWSCELGDSLDECTAQASYCGDGVTDDGTNGTVDGNEECEEGVVDADGNPYTQQNCNFDTCQVIDTVLPVCGVNVNSQFTTYDNSESGETVTEETQGLCGEGEVQDFIYNLENHEWTWNCVRGEEEVSCNTLAYYCGDNDFESVGQVGEDCDNGDQNGVLPDTPGYEEDAIPYCTIECVTRFSEGPSCGDGDIQPEFGEECEDSSMCGDGESCSSCGCTTDPVAGVCGEIENQSVYDFDNSGDFFDDLNNYNNLQLCENGSFEIALIQDSYSSSEHTRSYRCMGLNEGSDSELCVIQEQWCDDGIENGNEDCDRGALENMTPSVGYEGGTIFFCNEFCEDDMIVGGSCGDGIVQDQDEECDNGTNDAGQSLNTGVTCNADCTLPEDIEISCNDLVGDFVVTYDNDGNQIVGVSYDCDANGTDEYQVVIKDSFGGPNVNMAISNTATGVFYEDFITLNGDYWLECYLGGVEMIPSNLLQYCADDVYGTPLTPYCDDLSSTLVVDEVPGQIDFTCEGIYGDYTVNLINDDTQVLLETRTGPEGEIFTGSFVGLGEGEYRVECLLGDQNNIQPRCVNRHTLEEDPVIVPDSCEQLTIQGGTKYTSLPATIEYSCRGQPGPVDANGFEVRVFDTHGNVISTADDEGNIVSVLNEQSGSFVLTQEGYFTVSCEYNGVGSEQCDMQVHIELPEVGGVCEELLLSDDRIELGGAIDLSCTGVGELFEVIVTNQQGQEVFSGSSDESFIASFTPQDSGVYTAVCLVDGTTNPLCKDTYTKRLEEKTTHRIKGIQRNRLVPTELAKIQPAVYITKYQKELREIEKKTAIETSRACEDTCKGKFVVEKKDIPGGQCAISDIPDTLILGLGETNVSVPVVCRTAGLFDVGVDCDGGILEGDTCVYETPGLYVIQCIQDGKPIEGCKDAVRVIKEDPEAPVCEIKVSPTDTILEGEEVSVAVNCETKGYSWVDINCGGGEYKEGRCVYSEVGTYTISCENDAKPIEECDQNVWIKKLGDQPQEPSCELSYSPEDKIIKAVSHTVSITCETVGYESTGVQCGDSVLSGSTAECVLPGEGSYQIGCTSNSELITGCQDIITLKKETGSVFDFCGDGVVQTPNDDGLQEECDDGNSDTGDGCFACKNEGGGGGFNGGGRRSSINSYCGDGVINVGEFCDEGSKNGSKSVICTSSCEVKPLTLPTPTPDQVTSQIQTGEPPKCSYIDPPSIQAGELLPFWRGVEDGTRGIGCEELDDAGNIDTLSMYCTFEWLTPDGGSEQFTRSCITQDLKEANRYEDFIATNGSLGKYLGADVLDTSEFGFDTYGEYRIQLVGIDYQICEVETVVTTDGQGNETVTYEAKFVDDSYDGRICQMNVAVTSPYYLNKGTSLTSTTDDKAVLDNFADVAGNRLTPRVQESLSLQTANSQEFERMQERARLAIPLATQLVGGDVLGTSIGLMKSPANEIYVAYENITIEGSRVKSDTPRVLIVDGEYTVTIRGSLNANIMVIATEGEIVFDAVSCDVREEVSGIYIAKHITGSKKLANDSMSTYDWCAGGGLTIKGMVIGSQTKSLSRLVMRRRSTLENRFEGDKDITQKVFDGASLRIDNDAIQWTSLPPLASDMLETLQIIRQ